jgi:hypothetical protein
VIVEVVSASVASVLLRAKLEELNMYKLRFVISIMLSLLNLDVPSCVAHGDDLWDNGAYDGRGAWGDTRTWFSQPWIADDIILTQDVLLQSATAQFYVALDGADAFERADVALWSNPSRGGEPGGKIIELRDVPVQWAQIGEGFGLPIIAATVRDLNIPVVAGDYYFGVRLVNDPFQSRSAYLATTGNGAVKGSGGGWWYRDGPGIPEWQPSEKFLGYKTDFAFRLDGEVVPEPSLLSCTLGTN